MDLVQKYIESVRIAGIASISSIDFIHMSGYFCFMLHTELGIEGENIKLKTCMTPRRQGLKRER